MESGVRPELLPANIINHFYRGGARIAELRGVALPNSHRPEEWLGATTERAGEPGVGLSRLADGRLLRDVIAADPLAWIGSNAGRPGDGGLLVKLIDPAQRLPVHVHPNRAFAASHLNCPYGKTEAWFVLGVAGEEPSVWLGWNTGVDPAEVAARVATQDSSWLLDRLHRRRVAPGDGILVPAGTAHAIGPGVFVMEVQEPTDFSILLEWSITTATREESHLDLGFPTALTALDYRALTDPGLAELTHTVDLAARSDRAIPLLPAAADPFFRLTLLAPADTPTERTAAGFAVVVVLEGAGELSGTAGTMAVTRGQAFVVPFGFGDWRVSGDARLVACRPGAGWPESLAAG